MTDVVQGGGAHFGEPRSGARATYGRRRRDGFDSAHRRAAGLGWLSIGLGLSQITAPHAMSRLIGLPPESRSRGTMLAVGLRELTAGLGILTRPRPATWVWARLAGDLIDLALLGKAMRARDGKTGRLAAATAAVAGVTVLDAFTSAQLLGQGPSTSGPITASITINRPAEEVYAFWRDFQNLPRFMANLERVDVHDHQRTHWVAKAPAGRTVEWDATIVEDRPSELIAWRSVEGSEVPSSGTVRFVRVRDGRATEVHVELQFLPPGGLLGLGVAKIFGRHPTQQITGDLRRFKQVLETGEVVHSDASVHRGPHPAQPSEHHHFEVERSV